MYSVLGVCCQATTKETGLSSLEKRLWKHLQWNKHCSGISLRPSIRSERALCLSSLSAPFTLSPHTCVIKYVPGPMPPHDRFMPCGQPSCGWRGILIQFPTNSLTERFNFLLFSSCFPYFPKPAMVFNVISPCINALFILSSRKQSTSAKLIFFEGPLRDKECKNSHSRVHCEADCKQQGR